MSIFIIISMIFSFSFVYSTCLNTPNHITVSSGSYDLGNFTSSYLTGSDSIYIKEDLDTYPINIKFYFKDIDEDCFTSEDDLQMKLTSTGDFRSISGFSTEDDYTVGEIVFDTTFVISNYITSTYTIVNRDNPTGSSSNLKFTKDIENPDINIVSKSPDSELITSDSQIDISYTVSDYESGLDTLSITGGGASQTINFEDGNKTSDGVISETISSSTTYTITATDKLGHSSSDEVSFAVDNTAPTLSDFEVFDSSFDGNKRVVSCSVVISDSSFDIIAGSPVVYGNFSEINSAKSNIQATCVKTFTNAEEYICRWDDIEITELETTSTVSVQITGSDLVDNEATSSFSSMITYDVEGPEITSFYLENSMGVSNMFNALDTEVKVILEFTDETAMDVSDINIVSDFDGVDFLIVPEINITDGQGEAIWELGSTLAKYSGLNTGNVTFEISLKDKYGNPSSDSITVFYNNNKPLITKIEVVETTDILDGILKSGEKIDIELLFDDDNFDKSRDGFMFADLSNISTEDDMNNFSGSCSAYNSTTYLCKFKSINLDNGHFKRNVSFYVIDTAANVEIESYEIEVFAIGNESPSSFDIPEIKITNILNRNVIYEVGSDAWFEGQVVNLDTIDEDIRIVNYQLVSCNDSEMMPITLSDRELYPDDVMQGNVSDEPSRDFVIKIEVDAYQNYQDMNEQSMKCTMSILKRDAEKVYDPELVDFNVVFDYYDLPHDDLLKANAKRILETIDEAEFIGSWFDSMYDIYSIFNKVCTTINTIRTFTSSFSNVVNGIQWGLAYLNWLPPVEAASGGLGVVSHGLNNVFGMIVTKDGPIDKICQFVTCDLEFNKNARKFWDSLDPLGSGLGNAICDAGTSVDESIKSKNTE